MIPELQAKFLRVLKGSRSNVWVATTDPGQRARYRCYES